MGKPSVTNIRPPSQTTVWTPPKTSWNLNTDDLLSSDYANTYADHETQEAQFDALVGTINTSEPSGLDLVLADLKASTGDDFVYDYVFFGVNGGYDETVVGKTNAAGIIVTGNGMDNITGGGLGDLIFAGNGKDVVNAGAGNDIVFGENGADQLNGGSDTGEAQFIPGGGAPVINPGQTIFGDDAGEVLGAVTGSGGPTPNPNDPPSTYADPTETLQKKGLFIDGDDHVNLVFNFSPKDYPVLALEDAHTFTVVVLNNGQTTVLDSFTFNISESQSYNFAIDLTDNPNGGHVEIYLGTLSAQNLIDITDLDPQTGPSPIQEQGFDTLASVATGGGGNGTVTFEAGDQLIGGNGPDQFIWDATDVNNVDVVWDYNQGSGTYDALEGDTLVLNGVTLTDTNNDTVVDKFDLTTFLWDIDGVDQDGVDGGLDGLPDADDLVIFIDENQAIGLAGINTIDQVNVVFGP